MLVYKTQNLLLERQHEVVAGFPELLHWAVGWTVDEASPVVVQDGAEGRGRVARPDLILALLIDLEFLFRKSQVLIVF